MCAQTVTAECNVSSPFADAIFFFRPRLDCSLSFKWPLALQKAPFQPKDPVSAEDKQPHAAQMKLIYSSFTSAVVGLDFKAVVKQDDFNLKFNDLI